MPNTLSTRLIYEWLLALTQSGKMDEAHLLLESLDENDKKDIHKLTIQQEIAAVKREQERKELTEEEVKLVQDALANANTETLRFLAAITYDYMRVYLKFRAKDFSRLIEIAEYESTKSEK